MKFNSVVIRNSVLCGCSNPEEGIEFIEKDGWEDDGKWSSNYYVFKYKGKFYGIDDYRSGSYYTDYYYGSREDWGEEIECHEVEKVEVVIHEWRVIKSDEEEEEN
jgi:hypothetical protein